MGFCRPEAGDGSRKRTEMTAILVSLSAICGVIAAIYMHKRHRRNLIVRRRLYA